MNFALKQIQTISVPTSFVRAPGGLLINKKYSLEHPLTGNKSSEYLIKSEPVPTTISNDGLYIEKDEVISCSSSFFRDPIVSCAAPGQLKIKSDDISNLIQRASKTLLTYGISLIIDLTSNHYKDACSTLKVLISEIPLFPNGFFHKIQMDQMIICSGERRSLSQSRVSLQIDQLDTDAKISKRLYKMICDHIVTIKPEIAADWKTLAKVDMDSQVEKSIEAWSIEESFVALMNNLNHPLLKEFTKRLKELLIKYYPEELSENWFQTRNKTKKGMCRVRFSIS